MCSVQRNDASLHTADGAGTSRTMACASHHHTAHDLSILHADHQDAQSSVIFAGKVRGSYGGLKGVGVHPESTRRRSMPFGKKAPPPRDPNKVRSVHMRPEAPRTSDNTLPSD